MAMTLPSAATTTATNALAVDSRSLNALKYEAGQNSPQAAKEAAKQFESLFMREMIKSMREATMKSGLMEGGQADLGTDMLDQQLSIQMSGRQGGLGGHPAPADAPDRRRRCRCRCRAHVFGALHLEPGRRQPARRRRRGGRPVRPRAQGPRGFVQHHRDAAERVAKESGIPASFMLGQAGHETGWGKSEIRSKDGDNSFNLFGIKAGKGWTGKVAEITTTEYIGGVPRKVTAKFRAYDSYEDSFKDYAKLINDNPRYEKAREKTHSAVAYATELQKAGYATDPEYASKLSRAINSTLRVSPRTAA